VLFAEVRRPEIAQLVHKPRRHGVGLDPSLCVDARMAAQRDADIFRSRGALEVDIIAFPHTEFF
jgi:hypothetical protein